MRNAVKTATSLACVTALLCACASPGQKTETAARDDPHLQIVMNCSAGVLANYKTSAEVESDLKSKLSLGIDVEDAVRGYIFGVLPESDRLKGYEQYLGCVKDQTPRGSSR